MTRLLLDRGTKLDARVGARKGRREPTIFVPIVPTQITHSRSRDRSRSRQLSRAQPATLRGGRCPNRTMHPRNLARAVK